MVVACYQFSFYSVTGPSQRPHQFLDHRFGYEGKWHDLSYELVEKIPVPVPEFFHGLSQAGGRVSGVTNMYLLGKVQSTGWWYFFPVAVLVKTPIAFLMLAFIGAVGILKQRKMYPQRQGKVGALSLRPDNSVGLLANQIQYWSQTYSARIYPFLSIVAGYGFLELVNSQRFRWLARISAMGLVVWMLLSSAIAHPDYLAYFNEFAGNYPKKLVDSHP